MYKYLFITLLIFAIFPCNSKKTEQELIYEAYREAKFGMTMEEVLKLSFCKDCTILKKEILINERYSKIGSHNYSIWLQFRNNILYKVVFESNTKPFKDIKKDLENLKKYIDKDYKEPHIADLYEKETYSPRVLVYGWKFDYKMIHIDIIRANQWSNYYRAALYIRSLSPEEMQQSEASKTTKEETSEL